MDRRNLELIAQYYEEIESWAKDVFNESANELLFDGLYGIRSTLEDELEIDSDELGEDE